MSFEELQAVTVLFRDIGLAAGIFLVGSFLTFNLIRFYSAASRRNDEMTLKSMQMNADMVQAYKQNSEALHQIGGMVERNGEIVERSSSVSQAVADTLREFGKTFSEKFETLATGQLNTLNKVEQIRGTIDTLPTIAQNIQLGALVQERQHGEVVDLLHAMQEDHQQIIKFLEKLVADLTPPTPPTEPDRAPNVVSLPTDADGAKHNAEVDAA